MDERNYTFRDGNLYIHNYDLDTYSICYKCDLDLTKKEAIKEYETLLLKPKTELISKIKTDWKIELMPSTTPEGVFFVNCFLKDGTRLGRSPCSLDDLQDTVDQFLKEIEEYNDSNILRFIPGKHHVENYICETIFMVSMISFILFLILT